MSKVKALVEIPDGKYCRKTGVFCQFLKNSGQSSPRALCSILDWNAVIQVHKDQLIYLKHPLCPHLLKNESRSTPIKTSSPTTGKSTAFGTTEKDWSGLPEKVKKALGVTITPRNFQLGLLLLKDHSINKKALKKMCKEVFGKKAGKSLYKFLEVNYE